MCARASELQVSAVLSGNRVEAIQLENQATIEWHDRSGAKEMKIISGCPVSAYASDFRPARVVITQSNRGAGQDNEVGSSVRRHDESEDPRKMSETRDDENVSRLSLELEP